MQTEDVGVMREVTSQVRGLICIRKGRANTQVWNKNTRKLQIDAITSKAFLLDLLVHA